MVPASVRQVRPCWVGGDCREQAKHLCVAGGAVAPAVAVALNAFGFVLWVGVRDQEPCWVGFIAGYDVGGAGDRELDQIGPARRVTDGR